MSSEASVRQAPRVSIVMTAYNHASFIRQAIDSCLAQTLADFELIVVNDGSRDATEAIVRTYDDPRIVLISQENRGPSLATNAGILAARGEYVALMSGDDVCEPHRLERQWEASRTHPGAAVFSHVTLIDGDDVPIPDPDWIHQVFNVPPYSRAVIARRFVSHGNILSAPSAFVPRSLLLEAGLMNPALFQLQDFELWLRLLLRTDFYIVPMPLLRYRLHDGSLSRPSAEVATASLNELELVYSAFFRGLTPDQFYEVFDVPRCKHAVCTETFFSLEIAFFLRVFRRPLLDRISNTFLYDALSSGEGADLAHRYFNYAPRAFWNDLKAFDPGLPRPHVPSIRPKRTPGGKAETDGREQSGTAWTRLVSLGLHRFAGAPGLVTRVGRRAYHLRQQMARFGPRFSWTYLGATIARRLLKRLEQPLLEAAIRQYAYHPVANLRRGDHLRGGGTASLALGYYKRAFLTETTLFLQQPATLKQFLGLLREAGRTFELRAAYQRLDSIDMEPKPLDAVFTEADLALFDRYAPEVGPDRPVRHGLFHSVVDIKFLDEWLAENAGSKRVFDQGSTYAFRLPQIYGRPAPVEILRLEVPSSFMATTNDVLVGPGFTVLSDEKQEMIVYEPAAHPRFGNVSGLRGLISTVPGHPGAVRLIMNTSLSVHLPEAVLLSGRCSANYFHWLIEYLPKFLEIEAHGGLDGVPLLIGDRMPFQHYEALFSMSNGDHPVVYLDNSMVASVETLYIPSFSTYVPDDFDSPLWKAGVVSKKHIDFLRARVLGALEASPQLPGKGKRIFVSRARNAGRSMTNEVAILAACKKAGFTVVYPELMSFLEQVACFHEAEVIMGPTGAAFANVVFCQPGTAIYGLTSERNEAFCNFANLATTVGCDFVNVTGPNNRPRSAFANEEEFAHSSFTVPFEKVEAILRSLARS